MREPTQVELGQVASALADKMRSFRTATPEEKAEQAKQTVEKMYQEIPDGAEAQSGATAFDDASDEVSEIVKSINASINDPQNFDTLTESVGKQVNRQLDELHQFLTSEERQPVTPASVDSTVPNNVIFASFLPDVIKQYLAGKEPNETPKLKEAKKASAQSARTDIKPEVANVMYKQNTCTSQGKEINYKVVYSKTDWGNSIKNNSKSTAEAVETLISYITNSIMDNYGGWARITEIIVRDQRLIINRTCYCPVIDKKTVNPEVFPIDTLDYITSGAIAGFFDWGMLANMRNLMVLDIDDLGFYEVNVGGRLKCGRRIGVSTLFNLCKSLEILILGGDVVHRDDLNKEEATPVKKKLAAHKRFHLFADGYKINVMKGTSALADWTFGNLKAYANNRGDKGIFKYTLGILGRTAVAGAAGLLNLGTHLLGGIRETLKEAMTPINPEDVGLQ